MIRNFFSTLLAWSLARLGFGEDNLSRFTTDVAFTYRMGAGFPGDVNRTHPASILPALINTTTPPRAFGDPVIVNTADNTVKGVVPGDNNATAAAVYGITVRSYPTQQQSGGMSSALGAAVPPTSGIMDVLRQGFIFVKLPAGAAVTKNGIPYIWCAATSGNNIQGAFVAAASAGNTLPVSNARFTGPADANGVAELEVWSLA